MNEIVAFLANYYLLFIIIAIFSIFALIGYIVESKNGGRNTVVPPMPQTKETLSSNLDVLKSSLANKSLNSMLSDSLQNNPTSNTNSTTNAEQNEFQQADKL